MTAVIRDAACHEQHLYDVPAIDLSRSARPVLPALKATQRPPGTQRSGQPMVSAGRRPSGREPLLHRVAGALLTDLERRDEADARRGHVRHGGQLL
eukprot:5581580-Pleurochrysis_carterae.AAC.2